MPKGNFEIIERDGFVGRGHRDILDSLNSGRLAGLQGEIKGAREGVLAQGRHRVVVLSLERKGVPHPVAVKAFGRQSGWKDRLDRKRGTKAMRSFEAARFLTEHGVSTPEPLAVLDRWEKGRIVESYYLSSYLPELTSFKKQLVRLYQESGPCRVYVELLERVARAMRRMHDAGFCHRDLGNQNIELEPGDGPEGVHFIDLNRGRIEEELTMEERVLDFARLELPSEFLKIFGRIYWDSQVPPGFEKALRRRRRLFHWWQRSRRWRHPVKSFKRWRRAGRRTFQSMKDVWIWDDRSAQAAITLNKEDRRKCHSWRNHLRVAWSNLRLILGVWREYRRQLETAFGQRVCLADRIGMSLEPTDLEFDPQLPLLEKLGRVPVLLRFGHHEGAEQWEENLARLDRLHRDGHAVMVAVLQDRRAILDPASWEAFLERLFEGINGKVAMVEVCHVVNRVKWGIHDLQEYRQLMKPVAALQARYPEIKVTGPACIDFEFHYAVAALAYLPAGLRFEALSHHLYVDRRGAPENKQGRFGTVEKAALLKAIAIRSRRCGDKVVVSEVNWPLVDTGVWSPVSASYLAPGSKGSRTNVSEEKYACFMIRYLALTLCSGFVDQVYWWRLVAHGFGLVDERAEGGWRERVGFRMLVVFLRELGEATFVEKLDLAEEVYGLRFERGNDEVILLWGHGRTWSGPWPGEADRVLDAEGREIVLEEVGESPVYLISRPCPPRG